MKVLIADMGESIDSTINKLINSKDNTNIIKHYQTDPKIINSYIEKHKYDLIAINCNHPRGKTIAALLHEKKDNNKFSGTIVEVYKNNGKQTTKTYK